MEWTLILTYFRSLPLAHLERCLYSLSKQTAKPDCLLLFDNNSPHSEAAIRGELGKHFKSGDWALYFAKHGNPRKGLSWGSNRAIELCDTESFIFARADYIYDFRFCERALAEHEAAGPMSFATAWMFGMPYYTAGATHETASHETDLEALNWRDDPQRLKANCKGGHRECNSHVDGPTFCTSKQAVKAAGWYDEHLVGWGLQQQNLQTEMARHGVLMRVIPEFLYFHMEHGTGEHAFEARDLKRAFEEWHASPRRTQAEYDWLRDNIKIVPNPL